MKIDQSWYIKPEGIKERLVGGGVVCRVINNKVCMLLVQEPGSLKWGLPKGGIEEGETLEEGARREVKEESGADNLELVTEIGKTERLTYAKDFWSVTHFFLFKTDKENGSPTDKHIKYISRWFPLEETSLLYWPEQGKLIDDNREKIKSFFEVSPI